LAKGEVFGVWQRGRCSGFGKGGGVRGLAKGEVFGVWQRGRYSEAIFGSYAGKFPKTAEHSPPLKKGGQGGFLGEGGFLFS
jgi:hypothetical protein